jgi:hypothetical protein
MTKFAEKISIFKNLILWDFIMVSNRQPTNYSIYFNTLQKSFFLKVLSYNDRIGTARTFWLGS